MGLDNPLHVAVLVVILLLVFGAKRLPEMGRSIGTGMREFKDSVSGSTPALTQGGQPQQQAQPQPVAAQAQPLAQAQVATPPPAAVPPAPVAPPVPVEAQPEPTHQA
jgi:sec-independent protein translocase protein TatA